MNHPKSLQLTRGELNTLLAACGLAGRIWELHGTGIATNKNVRADKRRADRAAALWDRLDDFLKHNKGKSFRIHG